MKIQGTETLQYAQKIAKKTTILLRVTTKFAASLPKTCIARFKKAYEAIFRKVCKAIFRNVLSITVSANKLLGFGIFFQGFLLSGTSTHPTEFFKVFGLFSSGFLIAVTSGLIINSLCLLRLSGAGLHAGWVGRGGGGLAALVHDGLFRGPCFTAVNTLAWALFLRDHPWNIFRDCLFSFVPVFSSNPRYRAPLSATRGRARCLF